MTASEKWDDYLKVGDRRDVDMGTALRIVADLAAAEAERDEYKRKARLLRKGLFEYVNATRQVFDAPIPVHIYAALREIEDLEEE